MKKTPAVCSLFGCVALLTASALPGQEPQRPNETRLVAAINEFSVDLYRRLATANDNLCLSPASISTALLMAHAGARGTTRTEMEEVLCLEGAPRLEGRALHSAVEAVLDRLKPPAHKPDKKPERFRLGTPAELRVVNAMWGQEGYPFSRGYLTTLAKIYRAEVEHLDFAKNRIAAGKAINAWVDRATSGKIKTLVSPGALPPTTRVVLTNAVYFKGAWVDDFWDKATKPVDFHLEGARPVVVPTMHQTAHHAYFEDATVQVLQMSYVGSSHAMMVLLPRKGRKLAAFEKTLTWPRLREVVGKLKGRYVRVALPRFRITSRLPLARHLRDMGMPSLFDPQRADLSGVNDGQEPLCISAVLHKTYIDVDEEGTEAAAATGMMFVGAVAPKSPTSFQADRPFVFLLRDVRSGLVLFMGRVMDPRSES